MRQILSAVLLLCCSLCNGQDKPGPFANRVTSTIDSTRVGELVLVQKFMVNVPVQAVWDAFTTKEGWESAFVAKAEIDFRIGGVIKSSYDKNATIGDSTTIVNHIINYVPRKVLTLQAEIADNFPEFMKSEAKQFYNIVYFRAIDKTTTHVESYGVGYKNTPKYLSLLNFFVSGNDMSYVNLIKYLETGEKVKY